MTYSYTSLVLQRIVLPIILVAAALFRPVGISFVYLLMFFVSPYIPVATLRNFKGSVTAFLVILIAQSTLLILCHISLQLVIISFKMENIFGNCSFTEQLLRHVGFVDFRNLNAIAVVEWLIPEVVVFVTALVIYLVIKRLVTHPTGPSALESGEGDLSSTPVVPSDPSGVSIQERNSLAKSSCFPAEPNFEKLIKISPLFCIASLFFAAVLRPSVPGSIYFLIFLLIGTYWATMKSLGRGFSVLLRVIMLIIILHLLCVVAYQTPWMQQHLDKDNQIARLIGLEPLVVSSCDDIRIIIYDTINYTIASYCNPLVLCISFYTLALSAKNLSKKPVSLRRAREQRPMITEPTETTPLVRSVQKTNTTAAASSDNSTDPPITSSDIYMETLNQNVTGETEQQTYSSVCDQIIYGFISIGGFIYQNSYIFTNILMMAWSIIYHSWLTFVFLLWANLLWMIPNQRKAMMRSSPFIVFYAEALLIAQYIYGMNLTSDELPTKVNLTGINLAQIGLVRPLIPCIPLFVKTSFLLMFWITLRQYLKEKKDILHDSRFTIFAPIQLPGTGNNTKKTSIFLKRVGEIFKSLLVRLWIWLLILIIFLCAIAGRHMTVFRICYMALFLFFLLVFQSSSKVWIKIMYGFWLCLIFYVMTILILIYTYQFDKFDQYWSDYLNIPTKLQLDIGLERYKTKDLFLHLLSPTLIVILTVIQVHYFHKRFIASLEKNPSINEQQRRGRRRSFESVSEPYSAAKKSDQPVINLLKIFFRRAKRRSIWLFKTCKDIFWRILELHILKLVYLSAFICCVNEVCVLHILLVVLCILGVCSNISVSTFISRIISLIISIIVLTKMMYQVAYLDHNLYDTNCTSIHHGNRTVNDAEWFGLKKALPEEGGLMSLLRLYIIYMVIVTLHAVVMLRQSRMRFVTGTHLRPIPVVLFPKITRASAEKNLNKMIKYLFNYGFYKFGLETTMIWLVATITYRQDIVALLYSIWLVVLLLLERSQVARIWMFFLWCIASLIILQYLIFVGLPPSLCIIYPWDESSYNVAIQRWTMLPGCLNLSHVSKSIFDFVLLMFIMNQQRVFKIIVPKNNSGAASVYPGGSNKSVLKHVANLGEIPFVNPTRDFLSNVRNYLDIFLNIVFSGFYWVTLAVVFVGGTNIHSFLALGYLVGAFVFLWEGSDFYLRPIDSILKRWKWLIAYNVTNIVIKTALQIGGCMFLNELRTYACWLVHVFGIACSARPFLIEIPSEVTIECPEATTQTSVLWDAICFAFLICQLRIFKSYYFCHMILDTRANNILASRGAEIIEDLRQKQIEHRQEHEREVLLKIKRKMEKIRATQQKMLRPILKPTHFDEYGNPVPASRPQKRREPRLHGEAVRAGDYYMFEDMDDKFELDIIEDGKDFLEEQEQLTESEKKMTLRKTLFEDKMKRVESQTMLKKSKEDIRQVTESVDKLEDEVDQPNEQLSDEHSKKSDIDKRAEKTDADQLEANPIARLFEGFLVSMIIRLNRFSRNYRYVNKILAEEKRILKESDYLNRSSHPGAASVVNMYRTNADSSMNEDIVEINASTSQNDITQLTAITPTEINIQSQLQSPQDSIQEQQQRQHQQQTEQIEHADHDIIEMKLDTVDAGVEGGTLTTFQSPRASIGPYAFDDAEFAARDHNIIIEVIISLWYAILSNTDLLCYIVIFVNQVSYASILSLPLPIMVFLWGTLSLPRPTKTFWVTLIAYTQAIVLIKCIFQFKLIWANYINLPNQPLSWEKILGVEERENYANIDLLVLLILFFHRFILKSHGLWMSKSSYKNDEMLSADNCEPEDMIEVNKSDGFLTAEETDEWRDAVSNPELMREMKINKTIELEKKPKEPTNEDRRKGGLEQKNKNDDSLERIREEIHDHLSHKSSEASDKYTAGLRRLKRTKYLSSLRKFFYNLVHKPRLPDDVYALMFICDFINFFVLLFGFSSFSSRQTDKDTGGVQTYLMENKVPIPFLIMLLVQFLLIVIDRALYLRKALIPKIIFHFLSVVGIHIWMFFIVPFVTERSFYNLASPIIFYIFKCFYMLLSSYQIKCGYPRRILGNFLTKSFSIANMITFKVFMLIPFLYELRTILDWLCTSTTMTMFDWLKMEGIFSEIFLIRCTRQMEQDFPAIRSQKKQLLGKLLLGGTIILIIVILIWGPLCIFALGKTVGVSNIPYEVTVTIRIGPYDPVYHTNNRESIFAFDTPEFKNMSNAYRTNREAISFLSGYDASDIAAIKLAGHSPSLWTISPPDKERLLADLKDNKILTARFIYSLTRQGAKGVSKTASSEIKLPLNATFPGRRTLIKMIEGETTDEIVTLPDFIPKFLKVPNSGDIDIVSTLMPESQRYRPLILGIHSTIPGNLWWEIHDDCTDDFHLEVLKNLPLVNCNSGIVMYSFNEKKFPETLGWFTGAGILGIYTTFVLVASRLMKSMVNNIHHKTMFNDLPYVDRVLQLCLDIYLVREALEFTLEEDLFAKLIFLYRSPETLIKWTRPVEDRNDDETDSESIPSRSSSRPLPERRLVEQHSQQQ